MDTASAPPRPVPAVPGILEEREPVEASDCQREQREAAHDARAPNTEVPALIVFTVF